MPSLAADRVRKHTLASVNDQLDRATEDRLTWFGDHPEQIADRVAELEREVDVERVIEVEAALTILLGIGLGLGRSRRWFLLPMFAGGMLLLHNVAGPYPLLPLLRRLGFRTQGEIEWERWQLEKIANGAVAAAA